MDIKSTSRKLPPLVEEIIEIKNNKQNKKKARRNVMLDSEISKELDEIKEDVIVKNSEINPKQHSIMDQYIPSQSIGKMYVEEKDKFKVKTISDMEKKQNQVTEMVNKRWNELSNFSPVQEALLSHKIFKTMALFVHGLLSGIALWQIVSSIILLQGGKINFLTNYSVTSMPVQCCYCFLSVICIISSFDRFDVWNPATNLFTQLLTIRNGAICIIFYIIGLLINLSCYKMDNFVWQYNINSTYWTVTKDSEASEILHAWQILNIIRGAACILGWMVISQSPLTDHFKKSLNGIKN